MGHHRRRTWLLTRWSKRQRQAALDAAAAAQETEQKAARRRVLEAVTIRLPVVRPVRRPAPARGAPLLTRGQAARSRRAAR